MNGQVLRGRLEETSKRLDAVQEQVNEVVEQTSRTKARLVDRANGTYIRLQEVRNGKSE